jgi:hypothetical protein
VRKLAFGIQLHLACGIWNVVKYVLPIIDETNYQHCTEGLGRVGNIPTSYSEGLGSNIGGPDIGYPDSFRGIPQSLRDNTGLVPQIMSRRFLPHPLQLIIQ